MLPRLLLLALLAAPQRLATYTDNHRILLIFAPTAQDPRLQDQARLLHGHKSDLADRDLIVLTNLVHPGPAPTANTLQELGPATSAGQDPAERTHFRIQPSDFTVILIGKDGGEKLRSQTPIPIEKLNSSIDAMPMRQDEMRNRKQ